MPGENGVLFMAKHLVHGFEAGLQASDALHLRQRLIFEIPERLITLLHTHNVMSKFIGCILRIPWLNLSPLYISQHITHFQLCTNLMMSAASALHTSSQALDIL